MLEVAIVALEEALREDGLLARPTRDAAAADSIMRRRCRSVLPGALGVRGEDCTMLEKLSETRKDPRGADPAARRSGGVLTDRKVYTETNKALCRDRPHRSSLPRVQAASRSSAPRPRRCSPGWPRTTSCTTWPARSATQLAAKLAGLEEELRVELTPKDPNDERNVVLEIRAGTGGDEATLFAAELFRMYTPLRRAAGLADRGHRPLGVRGRRHQGGLGHRRRAAAPTAA